MGIIIIVDAELCNGSTADSDSVCLGSNPSSAANIKPRNPMITRLYIYKIINHTMNSKSFSIEYE